MLTLRQCRSGQRQLIWLKSLFVVGWNCLGSVMKRRMLQECGETNTDNPNPVVKKASIAPEMIWPSW